MNKTLVKGLSYVGACIREGQPLAGVQKTPQILRDAKLFDSLSKVYGVERIKDYGDVCLECLPNQGRQIPPLPHNVNNLHLLDPLLGLVSERMQRAHGEREKDDVVVCIGGDHSVGSASIHSGLAHHPDLKVVWVDAHADFVNHELKGTPSQNYHGMPLSHITGVAKLPGFSWMKHRLPFPNVVLIAIRDLDDDEYHSLLKHRIKCFTMEHINKLGIGEVMRRSIQYLDPYGEAPFHISYDIDAIDPTIASQTGTRFRDGLSHREACHIVSRLVNERNVVSMDLVEVNTKLGDPTVRQNLRDQEHLEPVSETVGMAIDLIHSLCNKTLIL